LEELWGTKRGVRRRSKEGEKEGGKERTRRPLGKAEPLLPVGTKNCAWVSVCSLCGERVRSAASEIRQKGDERRRQTKGGAVMLTLL